MKVLIVGSGGREFTFTRKIAQSPNCEKLFIAPGNAGTSQYGVNVNIDITDFDAVAKLVRENDIDFVVVGPEAPLVKGIRDYFEDHEDLAKIPMVGPGKAGALLEGSKDYSKAFMQRHGIPTAGAKTFTRETLDEGLDYLDNCSIPVVLKADGLAAGKGVIIATHRDEAKAELREMLLNNKFGEASARVLIEEYLDGMELSVFVLTDGESYLILPEAKDYKRIGERDSGPNTGGMGAVSPVIFATDDFMDKVEKQVVIPTIEGLKKDEIPYKGFVFIGLMKVGDDPYVIEYNVRMGDPETQVVLPRVKNDLLELLHHTASGTLSTQTLDIDSNSVATVVMVAGGYPGKYEKGIKINGLADVPPELVVVHAGTKTHGYNVRTNGGRVLSVTGMGETLEQALSRAYSGVRYINWNNCYYRRDIGKDILSFHLD